MASEEEIAILADRIRSAMQTKEYIEGCSEGEVIDIISANNSFTPCSYYISFMRCLGRSAGGLFRGTDLFYPGCLDALEDTSDIFSNEERSGLFVFGHHQGYQTYFFRIDDPSVYIRTETDFEIEEERISPSFLEFVKRSLNGLVKQRNG